MPNITNVSYGFVIRRRWAFITVITLIVVLMSLSFSLIQPFQYESQVKVLVIQKSSLGIDAYSASKSAERIGNNLAQIIYSSNFLSRVLNSGFNIDKSYFPEDEQEKRDFWNDSVATEVPSGTTLLHVSVFHEDQDQAAVLASAIAYVLDRDVEEYVGISDVDLKIVDDPLTSEYPVRPNVLLNVILAFVVGFFLSIAFILVTYNENKEVIELYKRQEKQQRKLMKKNKGQAIYQKQTQQQQIEKEVVQPKNEPQMTLPDVEESMAKVEQTQSKSMPVSTQKKAAKPKNPFADLPKFSQEDEIQTMK